jgi:hypothetical protein
MENRAVLLNAKQRRRWRRDLIAFFDAVTLFLVAGFDLSYSWPSALQFLANRLNPDLRGQLAVDPQRGLGLADHFQRLEQQYPDPSHRLWFGVLAKLYGGGAGMAEVISSLNRTLRIEQQRELETLSRALPLRANLVLLVFFLPPALILLFVPLVLQVLSDF